MTATSIDQLAEDVAGYLADWTSNGELAVDRDAALIKVHVGHLWHCGQLANLVRDKVARGGELVRGSNGARDDFGTFTVAVGMALVEVQVVP